MTTLFQLTLMFGAAFAAGVCAWLTWSSAKRRDRTRREQLRAALASSDPFFEHDPDLSRFRFKHRDLEVCARVEDFRYSALRASSEGIANIETTALRAWISTASSQPNFILARADMQLPPTKVLPETRVPASWGVAMRAYAAAPERLSAWMQAHPSPEKMGFGGVLELSIDAGLASVVVEGELTRTDDLIRLADLLRASWSGAAMEPTVPPDQLRMASSSMVHISALGIAAMAAFCLCFIPVMGSPGGFLERFVCLGSSRRTVEAPSVAALTEIVVTFACVFCAILTAYLVATRHPAQRKAVPQARKPVTPYR